jgi:hypothetical protein
MMGTSRIMANLQAAMAPFHEVSENIRRLSEGYLADAVAASRLAAMAQLPRSLTDTL